MPLSAQVSRLEYGTELYTPIFIYVPYKDAKGVENYKLKIDKTKKNPYSTYTKFSIEKIETSKDKVIEQISIKNDKGKRVFVKKKEVKKDDKSKQG